jgi:predicted XRE-type DNA-binding protein
MKKKSGIKIRRGSDNVFRDLDFPDPDTHLLKAQLVNRIQRTLEDRGLKQADAARIVGVSQPDISRMLRGQFRDISVERIMRMLARLGYEVDIVIREHGRKAKADSIRLEPVSA